MDGTTDKEAFVTHHNYAECLASLVDGASLAYTPLLHRHQLPLLDRKANLIALTKRSLEEERRIVDLDKDYSFASTSWLPVKGYYLLFNLLLTIEYVINPEPSAFTMSHAKCLRAFTKRLNDRELAFDQPVLNTVFDGAIFQHREQSGANLSRRIGLERRFRIAMAKIADYKEEEWKRQKRINDFRTQFSREKRAEFRKHFTCSVFEFPYYMRLRASYRDFAFIEGVSTAETAQYFRSYYDFVMAFYQLLEALKRGLVKARL